LATRGHNRGAAKVTAGPSPAPSAATPGVTDPATTLATLQPIGPPPTDGTTTTLVPIVATPPPPTTSPAPPTTSAGRPNGSSTTTLSTAPAPIVTGQNAVLGPPASPITRPYGGDCHVLADPKPWTAEG